MIWVLAIISVEAITEILLHSTLFIKPKLWLMKKSEYLEELLSCGFCLSFWVSLLVFIIIILELEFILFIIAIYRISHFIHLIYGILKRVRFKS